MCDIISAVKIANKSDAKLERLLKQHEQHLGLYKQVAQKLNVSPSYVSRVANHERTGPKVMAKILEELRKLHDAK